MVVGNLIFKALPASRGSDQPGFSPIHSMTIRGAGLLARPVDSANQT